MLMPDTQCDTTGMCSLAPHECNRAHKHAACVTHETLMQLSPHRADVCGVTEKTELLLSTNNSHR